MNLLPLSLLFDMACMYMDIYRLLTHYRPFMDYLDGHPGYKQIIRNSYITVEKNDTATTYYLNNLIHRDNDLPAVIWFDNDKEWYQYGELHRDNDLPAVIDHYHYEAWYQHGKRHRDNDLSAVIYSDGSQEWYQHGKRHRDNDLPAIIYSNGYKAWYQHGSKYKPYK